METISSLAQNLYSQKEAMNHYLGEIKKADQLRMKADLKDRYEASELEILAKNRDWVQHIHESFEKEEKQYFEHAKNLIEILKDIGIPTGAKVFTTVTNNDSQEINYAVWHNTDGTLGEESF